MHKTYPKKQTKIAKYDIMPLEAKYRIFMIPDREKFERVKNAIKENQNYCIRKKARIPDNICMCKAFLERDEECTCGCGIFYKQKRTASEIEKYLNAKPKFDEKKEKEVEKQMTKEEKEKQKIEEGYEE